MFAAEQITENLGNKRQIGSHM